MGKQQTIEDVLKEADERKKSFGKRLEQSISDHADRVEEQGEDIVAQREKKNSESGADEWLKQYEEENKDRTDKLATDEANLAEKAEAMKGELAVLEEAKAQLEADAKAQEEAKAQLEADTKALEEAKVKLEEEAKKK